MTVLLLLGTSLCATAAGAEEDAMQEAAQRFQKGVELFEEAEYEAALAEFHWAYNLKPHFAVLYNIAQCYYAIGRHGKALSYFTRYLEEGEGQITAEREQEVRDAIAHLEELMAELAVSSTPEGAKVMVDGKLVGTTPFPEPVHVPAGPHTLEVALEGHLPVHQEVILTGGETFTRTYELEEDRREGSLTVTATAPKSTVYVDDREMGPAPWTGELLVGEHEVVVEAPGYHAATRPVVVMPGESREIAVELSVKGTPGKLDVQTGTQGAHVFVDGIDHGRTPISGVWLPAGIYKVSVVKEGHAEWEGDVTIREGVPTRVDVELASTEGKIGPAGFWIATSTTLAALAAGSVLGIMALGKHEEFEQFLDAIPTGSEGANEAELTRRYNDLKDQGRRLALGADVCWGIAGAAAVTAIFLAFFTRFRKAESEASIDFGPVAGGALMTVTGRWSM
jgi:hypothetical protein